MSEDLKGVIAYLNQRLNVLKLPCEFNRKGNSQKNLETSEIIGRRLELVDLKKKLENELCSNNYSKKRKGRALWGADIQSDLKTQSKTKKISVSKKVKRKLNNNFQKPKNNKQKLKNFDLIVPTTIQLKLL